MEKKLNELSDFLLNQIEKLNVIKTNRKTIHEFAEDIQESCKSGASQSDLIQMIEDYNKDLQHYHDSTVGLYVIDRNPIEVSKEFIDTNYFRLHPITQFDCIVNYDGRECKANVIAVNEDTFDVVTSFGAKMYNIPKSKFRAVVV